ncbi:MAG: hypothetical protein MZV63_15465 [Marinilabiliales bacterium]|nr:hypothetical protein [Marinilabiliales bacterium]
MKKGDLIAKVRIIPDMVNLNNAESRVKTSPAQPRGCQIGLRIRQKKVYEQGVIAESEFLQFTAEL